MQDSYFVQLLQFMCIEELGVDMLCEITLHITRLDLCNTSGIIFIDNSGGVGWYSVHMIAGCGRSPVEAIHTHVMLHIML